MRIDLYTDAGGNTLWKQVNTGTITRYTELRANHIVDYTIEGKIIKFGTVYIMNPVLKNDGVLFTSAETYNPYETVYCRNGFARFNVVSIGQGGGQYCEVNRFYYYLNSLGGGGGIHGYPLNAMRIAEVEIDGTQCIAFFYWMDAQQTIMSALIVSANFFDGSFAVRYTPPTTPDDDAGYGTGETPNGQQAGVGTQGGGDHISVYPPNVDVNVEINMPEPDKVQRAQPSNINIAVIDGTSLNALISALWGKSADGFANLWQQFENYKFNPMAGVVKCMKLPSWVITGVDKAAGSSAIGIAGTTILLFNGQKIGNPIVKKTYSIATSEGDNIPFARFNDFKDFVGVSVQAYAPFVGWFDLDPSLCFGGGIDFKYTCDASNGNLAVEIWGTSVGQNDTQKHYQLLASGGGNCAYDIIISGNDNGMGDKVNGFSQIASGVVTTAAGLITENVPAAAAGALGIAGGAFKATNAQQQTVMVGNISGSAGYLGYLIPFVRVIKPRYVLPDEYENIYGRPVSGGTKVSDFEGCYAELDIKCTDLGFANAQEQQRIISYLENGVIV